MPPFFMTCVSILTICVSCAVARAAPPIQPGLHFEKLGRPLLDLGGPGAFDECHAKYPCVLRVGDAWWMWYNGRSADCFTGQIGLATSLDGIRWTKANDGQPVFRHGPPGGFDATKVDHPAVLRFDGKFHMWYTAGDPQSRYTIGYATSRDGIAWHRENDSRAVLGPGPPGNFDEQSVLHPAVVRDEQGRLHIWYNGVGPQAGFRVGYAKSSDGIRWTKQNNGEPVLVPGTMDGRHEEYVYNVMVLREAGTFHMWYSSAMGLKQNRYKPNCSGIVYASSRDGIHWAKDATPVFYNGSRGSLDEYSAFACYVVRRSDGLWMYYSCGTLIDAPDPRRFTISLAVHQFP